MLNSYCEKAQLRDGQDVLDLGCGWGSLCLFLAEKYPNSRIRALSNSKTQKLHIDGVAKQRGFQNLQVFTGDVKEYQFGQQHRFDRILSIEMFEHVSTPHGRMLSIRTLPCQRKRLTCLASRRSVHR